MKLGDALRACAQNTPDAVAICFQQRETTFAQLRDQMSGIATYLKQECGVRHGDRVGYLGLNHDHIVRLVFACAEIGAIFAPLNSRLALAEYEYLLDDSEPAILFHDDAFRETAKALSKRVSVVTPISDLDKKSTSQVLNDETNGSDPLLLVYTSGTTGRPKGVVLTQDAVWANIENGQSLYSFQANQRILITLPLFHVGGLCILLLPALTQGATIVLHQRFDPAETVRALDGDAITTTILVPAQTAAMMALPSWEKATFATLDYIVVGSSVIPLDQIKAWHSRDIPVSQIYGATETGPSAIGLKLADCRNHEGSAGTPMPLCDIEIRDAERKTLRDNEPGDIWVRGPNVMQGYWRKREETAEVLVEGWYNTGDIGTRDANGFYWIIDRSKDVIISGGENIYPAEIEAISLEHNAIAAIAIVGKPDERWGETPVAVIEKKPDATLTADAYRAFLKDRIARYKQPKTIVFLDHMPRNGMGKIEKSVLREIVRKEGK